MTNSFEIGAPAALILCAVAVSAWKGGLGPALFAAALGTASGAYPLPAALAQGLPAPRLLSVSLGVFALEAVLIAALSADLRGARRQAEAAASAVRRLQAVTDAALAHLTRDELLGALLERVQLLLDADAAVVLLLDDRAQALCVRASTSPAGLPP